MKLMFASDIHGSYSAAKAVFEAYSREGAEKLILLGDLLYHGPRNDLPEGHDPKAVTAILNEHAGELLCVRGNCDAQIDQTVLSFPIMADYALIYERGRTFFITHGHTLCAQAPPALLPGDFLIHGHTHIPAAEEHGGFTYLNPGSAALPKGGFGRSYMTYCDGVFLIREFGGDILFERRF